MRSVLRGYRLVGIVGLGLGMGGGIGYGLSQWGLLTLSDRTLGILVGLMGLGLVIGAMWVWAESRQGQRDRAQWQQQRQGYEAIVVAQEDQLAELQQTQDLTNQKLMVLQTEHEQLTAAHQKVAQANAALAQECDRLATQWQTEALNCQNAEVVLEECDRLEQENAQLRQQVKMLERDNWQLREYPNCSPSAGELNKHDGAEAFDDDGPEHRAIPVSRLTGISGKRAIRALEQLGFKVEHQTGSHIKLHRTHTQTCIVPNHPEVNPVTLKRALRQGEVGLEEFLAVL